MARPMKPLVRSGGYYPSNRWTPLVYAGGYTTANGGGEPEPPPIEKTITGNPIHITDALAKPVQALSIALEPVQDLNGYSYPWPAGGGKNLLWLNNGIFKTGAFQNTTPRETTGVGTWVGISTSNYLAPNNITSYTIGDNSLTVTSTANGYGVGFECKVTAGQKYTLSWVGTNAFVGISFYGGNGAYLSYVASGVSPKTFTVPESTANAIIVLRGDGANVTGEFSNVQLEEGQTATAYSPYANICPISGWTGANVYHSGADTSDATTYSITFPDAAGTVYGGTLDVTNGVLTVDMAKIVLNGTQQISKENWKPQAKSVGWIYPYDLTRNIVGTGAVLQNIKCDTLPSMPFNSLQSINGPGIALASNQTYGISVMYPNTTLTTASAINAFLAEHPIDVVYELATPQTYQLTPTEVTTLLGENNIWSDADNITMTYFADGNASDEEALGILLGNRYVNNHGADEPTDSEALGILLGGNER